MIFIICCTIIFIEVAAVVAVGGMYLREWHRGHRLRVEHEQTHGNRPLRNRLLYLAGRFGWMTAVTRAETMRGWVWIVVTRDAPDPFVVRSGWSLTRWGASRAMAHAQSAMLTT